MKIRDFGVEIWMNRYETQCEWNLAETCVESLTVEELLKMAGQSMGKSIIMADQLKTAFENVGKVMEPFAKQLTDAFTDTILEAAIEKLDLEVQGWQAIPLLPVDVYRRGCDFLFLEVKKQTQFVIKHSGGPCEIFIVDAGKTMKYTVPDLHSDWEIEVYPVEK